MMSGNGRLFWPRVLIVKVKAMIVLIDRTAACVWAELHHSTSAIHWPCSLCKPVQYMLSVSEEFGLSRIYCLC